MICLKGKILICHKIIFQYGSEAECFISPQGMHLGFIAYCQPFGVNYSEMQQIYIVIVLNQYYYYKYEVINIKSVSPLHFDG